MFSNLESYPFSSHQRIWHDRLISRGRETGQSERESEREQATRVQPLFSLPTHHQLHLFQQKKKYNKLSGSKTHLIHS